MIVMVVVILKTVMTVAVVIVMEMVGVDGMVVLVRTFLKIMMITTKFILIFQMTVSCHV